MLSLHWYYKNFFLFYLLPYHAFVSVYFYVVFDRDDFVICKWEFFYLLLSLYHGFVKNETKMSKYEMMLVPLHVESSVPNSSIEIINIAIERILDKCRLGGSFIYLTSTLLNSIFHRIFSVFAVQIVTDIIFECNVSICAIFIYEMVLFFFCYSFLVA